MRPLLLCYTVQTTQCQQLRFYYPHPPRATSSRQQERAQNTIFNVRSPRKLDGLRGVLHVQHVACRRTAVRHHPEVTPRATGITKSPQSGGVGIGGRKQVNYCSIRRVEHVWEGSRSRHFFRSFLKSSRLLSSPNRKRFVPAAIFWISRCRRYLPFSPYGRHFNLHNSQDTTVLTYCVYTFKWRSDFSVAPDQPPPLNHTKN